jgi:hypothetical protein
MRLFVFSFALIFSGTALSQKSNTDFKALEAKIIDNDTRKPLVFTNIAF